jgi:hypothetical protein
VHGKSDGRPHGAVLGKLLLFLCPRDHHSSLTWASGAEI